MTVGSGQHFVGGDTLGTNPAAGSYRLAYTAAGVPFLQDSAGVQYFLPGNKGAAIVIGSAGATLTPPVLSNYVQVSFTTPASHTIAAIAATYVGKRITMAFTTAGTIVHSASLILPGAANITTYAGLSLVFVEESAGVWRCIGGLSLPVIGVTDGSSETAAGVVGECLFQARPRDGSSPAMTSGVTMNVLATPLTLTPGDWDLSGLVGFLGSATSFTSARGEPSIVSATVNNPPTTPLGAVNSSGVMAVAFTGSAFNLNSGDVVLPFNTIRVTISANQTIYLVANTAFSGGGGTCAVYGHLMARRAR